MPHANWLESRMRQMLPHILLVLFILTTEPSIQPFSPPFLLTQTSLIESESPGASLVVRMWGSQASFHSFQIWKLQNTWVTPGQGWQAKWADMAKEGGAFWKQVVGWYSGTAAWSESLRNRVCLKKYDLWSMFLYALSKGPEKWE